MVLEAGNTEIISLFRRSKPYRRRGLERKKRNGKIRAEMEVKPAGAGG